MRLLKCFIAKVLNTYIHTDRPSDEPGCRGAFAPKKYLLVIISAGQYRSTENVMNINSQIKSFSINYKTSIYFVVKNFNRKF